MPRRLILTLSVVLVVAAPVRAEEVIVRANRFAAYRGDAAFAVVNLNPDDLNRASLDQSLKRETQAALFRRSSSLTANPTVQGVSLRAIGPSGAGRALVTLDGVPQNDPFGGWVIWAALPRDAISHVHVVKGAGGGAYGAGALTGIIDLSLSPPQPGAGAVFATVGEGGNLKAAVSTTLGPVAVYYNDQTLHGDAPVRGSQRGAADIGTYGRDRAVFANGQWALCPQGDCGELSLMAGAYESRRDTGLKGATATSTGDQVALSLTKQPSGPANGWRIQAWHRDSGLKNRSVSVSPGRTDTVLANDQIATPATGDGVNAAIRHQDGATEWELGVDARLSDGESREYYRYVSGVASRYRVSGGKTSLAGVYGEGSRTIGAMSLSAALRADVWRAFDGHRTEADTATNALVLDQTPPAQDQTLLSARLGLDYRLSDLTSLRVAAYNGFRPPSLNELYRPFRVGNDVTEANAALRPETLKGFELGLRSGNARTFVDAGLFLNTLSDPVTNVTVGTGPATFPTAGFIPAGGTLRQRQNMGEIEAYGAEARGRYALTDDLALTASATLTHARVQKATAAINGKRPAQAPDYSAALGIEAHVAKALVHADWAFEGAAFDDDLNSLALKAYSRLSLDMAYPLSARVTLNVAIDNALDDKVTISHAGDGTLGYDNRRTVSVGLTYRR